MSDILSRGFKAQLTTAMDSISRRAVMEIMKIFENTLYDNQMELLQKGEEVAQLKIKLQRAELKLKDLEDGMGRHVETNKAQTNPSQAKLEVVMETPGQTSEVPEIDFEVPDYWCAPLGCEAATKPDEVVCPSVRLRPLSIPLWHIPVPKNEVVRCDIDQRKKGARRSNRISNLNEKTKPSKDKKLPALDQKVKYQSLRNEKLLIHDIKVEYPDQIILDRLRRRTNLSGKKQEHKMKSKTEQRKRTATESTSKEQERGEDGSKNAYPCKICKKMFNTEFGRSVHVRSHKKCRGCKKIFPFPSTLKAHKPYCRPLKKLLAREVANVSQIPLDEEETHAPNEKRAVNQKSTCSSTNNNHQGHKNEGKYSCLYCNKTFDYRFKFIHHMRVHTSEKPHSCSICQKTFRIAKSLKLHMVKRHNDQNRDINGDLSSTKPLEDFEGRGEDPVSPSKRTSQEVEQNKRRYRSERSASWQTMGIRHNRGFMCLSCHKVLSNKASLIEHYRIHTGERPLKCDSCPASFRFNTQLYAHKKKCRHPVATIKCEENDPRT